MYEVKMPPWEAWDQTNHSPTPLHMTACEITLKWFIPLRSALRGMPLGCPRVFIEKPFHFIKFNKHLAPYIYYVNIFETPPTSFQLRNIVY